MDDKKSSGLLFSQPSASMELYLQRLQNNLDGVEKLPEPAQPAEQERLRMLEAEEPRLAAPDRELVDRGSVIKLYRTAMDALQGAGSGEQEPE